MNQGMSGSLARRLRLLGGAVLVQFVLCFGSEGGGAGATGPASQGTPPITTCVGVPFAGFSGGVCGTGPGIRPP